jgi:hypothetical protein
MQVSLRQLVDALAPSPQRCIAELQQLLPCLAADAYNLFITRWGVETLAPQGMLKHPVVIGGVAWLKALLAGRLREVEGS